MLAQFSIWPLDQPHMSKEVAQAAEVLEQRGVRYEIGPMGTTLEGDWEEVMAAIQACHEMARGTHQRVLTTITIDDAAGRPQSIREAKAKVAAKQGA